MIPAWVEGVAIAVEPYGSRVTCDPPPTDTDEDWIICIDKHDAFGMGSFLIEQGFKRTDKDYGVPIKTYRKDELNVLVTRDREFFRRTMEATRLAKQFNLLNKADRIALFEVVTDQLYHYALPDETVEF